MIHMIMLTKAVVCLFARGPTGIHPVVIRDWAIKSGIFKQWNISRSGETNQSTTIYHHTDGSQKYDEEKKSSFYHDFIYTNFKKQSNLIRSKKNGYLEDTGVFVDFCFSCWMLITQVCSLWDNPLSCLFMWILFCICVIYFNKNHTALPPKEETLALSVTHLLH